MFISVISADRNFLGGKLKIPQFNSLFPQANPRLGASSQTTFLGKNFIKGKVCPSEL